MTQPVTIPPPPAGRERSHSCASSLSTLSTSSPHSPPAQQDPPSSSVLSALPSTSPFSSLRFAKEAPSPVSPSIPSSLHERRGSWGRPAGIGGELERVNSRGEGGGAAGESGGGMGGLFRRFSFGGSGAKNPKMAASAPRTAPDPFAAPPTGGLNPIPARQPLELDPAPAPVPQIKAPTPPQAGVRGRARVRRKSDSLGPGSPGNKRKVSPMGERMLRGSFDAGAF